MKTYCAPAAPTRHHRTTAEWLNTLGDDDAPQSFTGGEPRHTNNPRGRRRRDGTFSDHQLVTNGEIRQRHIDRGLVTAKGMPRRVKKILPLLTAFKMVG